MIAQMTHSMVAVGAGAAIAGDTILANLVLPAGDGWQINSVFGQVVNATPTAAQGLLCAGMVRSVSGDIVPNPSPCIYPINAAGAALGATIDHAVCPLSIFPVNWKAASKASVDMILRQYVIATVAPQAVLGLIFSGQPYTPMKPTNYDTIRAAVAVAAEAAVGVITLPQSAKRIVGICGSMCGNGVQVTLEELIGWFRLASDDVDLAPSQWPFSHAIGAGLGALINPAASMKAEFIPVDIPVPGGARINVTVDLNTAVTNAAEIVITLAYA